LELFAGLRGITKDKLEDVVSKWLRSVDLEEAQLQYASAYSGGMKRRLSLALATIGNRPLIILDEPTTGMDPVSRRFVWRHIDEIKEGRVILLTTHAMEEADLLADEVAIIRDGELAAFGSPLQLKSEHGTALQFSLMIDKDKVQDTVAYIEAFFSSSKESIEVDSSNSTSITLKILSMTEDARSDGVHANTLSDFVAWLDSDESPVKEYGFSNSSLEEVFLAVTGTHSQTSEAFQEDGNTVVLPDVEEGEVVSGTDVQSPMTSFEPKISFRSQIRTIFVDMWARSWIGRGAIANYVIYGVFVVGCLLYGFEAAKWYDPTLLFGLVVMLTSLILTSIIAPVYSDKTEGLLYLMQSQGLLSKAYVAGISLYGLSVYLVYGLIILGGFYGTSMFREPIECPFVEEEWGIYQRCSLDDWEKPWGAVPNQNLFYLDFEAMYEGRSVSLRVSRSPGGFGMIAAIIICFALTGVGAVLCTAFLPGYRIPLVLIILSVLFTSFWPTFDTRVQSHLDYMLCENMTDPEQICRSSLSVNNTAEEILQCAGLAVTSYDLTGHLCMDPAASILPQIGLLQTLIFAHRSKIAFVSDPPDYAENVLMKLPGFEDMSCDGTTCEFPMAHRLFRENMLFMCLGAVILFVLGIILTCLLAFPFGPFVYIRRFLRATTDLILCKYDTSTTEPSNASTDAELQEVAQERQTVIDLCKDFVSGEGTSSTPLSIDMKRVPRSDIPPVVARGLRKVYPALGGRPPKVALRELDLQVPKGQTLGLLGKNGAGKTTALKILAGAHGSTSGVGLVAGYDCNTEKLKIFERLGNCAQFDVVWKKRRVRDHLEFFALLKGVSRSKATEVARSAATAVGLGSSEEFHRNAGDLSGGMRRRLSIAISLVGSPNVNILDEPTTGYVRKLIGCQLFNIPWSSLRLGSLQLHRLDPATRNSIWKLIKSFSSTDRSIIITTHMMIEADVLCDRIAIVKDGALKVVGTQQHLKDSFGSGYNLQLNLVKSTPLYQEKAMAFVRENLHEGAELAMRQAKTLHVALPRDLSLKRVFRALYSKERETEGGINQFLLSQSSLEDVFVRMSE